MEAYERQYRVYSAINLTAITVFYMYLLFLYDFFFFAIKKMFFCR
jgi:hypothetical protein